MKNLKKLGLILSVGTIAALSITACGDDATDPVGTAGKGTGGSGTAGSGTAGSGTSGSATAGTSTGGSTAGSASGGAGGKGGAGGSGGAGGGGGTGGGGGAPSADCTKWCSGAMGVVTFCAGTGLAPNVDSEAKCIAHCTAPEASGTMGLACWNTHLAYAITNKDDAAEKANHCGHASGAPTPKNGPCNETK